MIIKRATLGEIWRKIVKVDDKSKQKIFINGENNLYPNEVSGVIANSPTACRASQILSTFIAGAGVQEQGKYIIDYLNQPIVNERKRWRISDFYKTIANSIAVQGGAFIWVGYKLDEDGVLLPSGLDVFDYEKCRLGKTDDNMFDGKIWVGDWEQVQKGWGKQKEDKKWYYPFSDNQDVIKAQILSDSDDDLELIDAIENYRGQVLFVTTSPEMTYPNSPADSVYNDCDSEYRIGVYINEQLRNGFTGKTVTLINGLEAETAEEIKADLTKFMGVENSSSLFIMELDGVENFDNVLKFIQLDSQYNDKLLDKTTAHLKKNILGAFYNVPEILVLSSDGALFGASGEALSEAKEFYSENTKGLRQLIEKTSSILGYNYEIIPIK